MENDTWRDSVYVKSRSVHECSCRLWVPSSVGKLHGEICYRSEFTVGCEEGAGVGMEQRWPWLPSDPLGSKSHSGWPFSVFTF